MSGEIEALLAKRRLMVDYLRMKVDVEDWHGCADAANDLREIDVELSVRRELENDGYRKEP